MELKGKKKGEIYEGKSHICWGGRIVQGADFLNILLTLALILIPAVLFSVFVVPFLITSISFLLPLFFYLLLLFTIASLLATSFTDPGIIPRGLDYRTEDPNAEPALGPDGLPVGYPFGPLKPIVYESFFVNGIEVKNKYCPTCRISRPPRCSHCSVCDNCVERFDHHCPWVGNCVGKRNHRFFLLFTFSCFILLVLTFACCAAQIALVAIDFIHQREPNVLSKTLATVPVTVVIAFYSFLLMWSLGGLTGFHSYYSCVNQTTNEDLKRLHKKNPYSKGCWNNFTHFFLGPRSPSFLDPTGEVYSLEDQIRDFSAKSEV